MGGLRSRHHTFRMLVSEVLHIVCFMFFTRLMWWTLCVFCILKRQLDLKKIYLEMLLKYDSVIYFYITTFFLLFRLCCILIWRYSWRVVMIAFWHFWNLQHWLWCSLKSSKFGIWILLIVLFHYLIHLINICWTHITCRKSLRNTARNKID